MINIIANDAELQLAFTLDSNVRNPDATVQAFLTNNKKVLNTIQSFKKRLNTAISTRLQDLDVVVTLLAADSLYKQLSPTERVRFLDGTTRNKEIENFISQNDSY
jgi:hypothetical protein